MKAKNISHAIIALLLFGLCGFSALSANEKPNGYNKFSFGINAGAMIAYTDVNPNSFMRSASDGMTFGGGLQLNYHLSPALTLHGRFMYAQLEGARESASLEFRADIYEATLNARISLNTLFTPLSRSNRWMNIYATMGAGLVMHESELLDKETGNVVRWPYQGREGVKQGDRHNAFVIPLGLGINFKVSERLDIGIESTFGYAFTDELDARVVAGSKQDMYNFTGIGLTFRLGKNTRSNDWAPAYVTMYPGDLERFNALAEQMAASEESIATLKDSHETDIETVKGDIQSLSDKQIELNRRNAQVYGTVEDIALRLLMVEAAAKEAVETEEKPAWFYTVQVMAIQEEISTDEASKHLNLTFDIDYLFTDGWYKYFSGRYKDLEDAKLHMMRIWGQGVKDAFIVKYKDGTLTPR